MHALKPQLLVSFILGFLLLASCGKTNSDGSANLNGSSLNQQGTQSGSADPVPSVTPMPLPPPISGVKGNVTTRVCGGAILIGSSSGSCHTTATPSTIEISQVGGNKAPFFVQTDSQGAYSIDLTPGLYQIAIQENSGSMVCGGATLCPQPRTLTVPASGFVEADFQYQVEAP